MALAVILIFVLPIIVLKALRAAPPQTPVAVASSAMPSMIKQDNASLPKPQPPPKQLLNHSLPTQLPQSLGH
jgi:hypothetical protein